LASRLFESVIASSVLLLGAVAAEACASSTDHSSGDGGDAQLMEASDASLASDAAIDDAVDAALTDARSQEAGWPTTKGATCVREPLSGPVFCCRGGPDAYCWTPTEPDGSGPLCIPDMTMRAVCTPCEPMSENAACQRPDVMVTDAASSAEDNGG
jgi:hypothetical protein